MLLLLCWGNSQVGLIQQDMKPEERRTAYLCDVTYVTNSELGFDYLRDNLASVRGGGRAAPRQSGGGPEQEQGCGMCGGAACVEPVRMA
jgi:hypothetical protein